MGSSEIQGKLWGAEPQDYTEINEPINKSLWEAMLAVAKVGQDTRFLDAGCGAGGTSVLAADLGAKITGLDASEALINIARQRVPNGQFRVGDIEELPYEDKTLILQELAKTRKTTTGKAFNIFDLLQFCIT